MHCELFMKGKEEGRKSTALIQETVGRLESCARHAAATTVYKLQHGYLGPGV